MSNALLKNFHNDEAFRLASVRATLQELRELALQSKLLALNTAIESVQSGETGALAEQARHALDEAGRVASAVDTLLEQINASAEFSRH